MFVGYCVGHRNHRYFCLFLFYMWLRSVKQIEHIWKSYLTFKQLNSISTWITNDLYILFFSVVYCTYFNTIFLSGQLEEQTWSQILKFIFPMVIYYFQFYKFNPMKWIDLYPFTSSTFIIFQVMIVTGLDASWLQLYIFFWSVHFAAVLLTTVLLLYHLNLVLQGMYYDIL